MISISTSSIYYVNKSVFCSLLLLFSSFTSLSNAKIRTICSLPILYKKVCFEELTGFQVLFPGEDSTRLIDKKGRLHYTCACSDVVKFYNNLYIVISSLIVRV